MISGPQNSQNLFFFTKKFFCQKTQLESYDLDNTKGSIKNGTNAAF